MFLLSYWGKNPLEALYPNKPVNVCMYLTVKFPSGKMKKKKILWCPIPSPTHTGEGISAAFEILKEGASSVHVERWHECAPENCWGRVPVTGQSRLARGACCCVVRRQVQRCVPPRAPAVGGLLGGLRTCTFLPSCARAAGPWQGSPVSTIEFAVGEGLAALWDLRLAVRPKGLAGRQAGRQAGFHHPQGGAGSWHCPPGPACSRVQAAHPRPSLGASTRQTSCTCGGGASGARTSSSPACWAGGRRLRAASVARAQALGPLRLARLEVPAAPAEAGRVCGAATGLAGLGQRGLRLSAVAARAAGAPGARTPPA